MSSTLTPMRGPRSKLRRVLQMYSRKVWHSSQYLTGLYPKTTWRIPPQTLETVAVGNPESKKDGQVGTSMFFFPVDKLKKKHALVTGKLGQTEQRLFWTAMDIVKPSKANDTFQVQYFSETGTPKYVENALEGVSYGFQVALELHGVGFRAEEKEDEIHMRIGFRNPHVLKKVDDKKKVSYRILTPTRIQVYGIDKSSVYQAASQLRLLRPPEPYKGKGIRYLGEVVKLKPGKKNQ